MTETALGVDEIEPAAFERELRSGAPVVVLDSRDRVSYAAWHVDPAGAAIVNAPEAELAEDLSGVIAGLPSGGALRVICNAGNASRRVVAALERSGLQARSVRGGMIGWSRVLQHDEVPLPGAIAAVQFRREARGCLSYLLAAGGEALVVDPAPDVEPYLEEAGRRGVRIVHVVDTHVHADHLSGARELARRTGAALHLSEAALARGVRYAAEVAPLRDGDELRVGGQAVRIVALPGHTTDMVGLQIGEEALIGGDSLFADSVARPDLENGDVGAPDAARALYRTLRERIAPLGDSALLLPCHYAGGRLDGPLAPALGDVRAAVPELALGEDAFVHEVLSAMPPRPANYLEIIAVNLGDALDADAAARLEVGANNCAAKAGWAAGAA